MDLERLAGDFGPGGEIPLQVGHVYRDATPHTIPGGFRAKMDTLATNTARFADVWLDEYTDFYKYMNPGT